MAVVERSSRTASFAAGCRTTSPAKRPEAERRSLQGSKCDGGRKPEPVPRIHDLSGTAFTVRGREPVLFRPGSEREHPALDPRNPVLP